MKFTQVTDIFLEKEKTKLIQEIRNYDDSFFIIISKFLNQRFLEENWGVVKYLTAGAIQSKMEKLNFSKSLKWNLYLVFLVEEGIDSELKKKIESDKFCCKKYVLKCKNSNELDEILQKNLPIFIDFDSFIPPRSHDSNENFLNEISVELNKEIEKETFENFITREFSLEDIMKIYMKGDINEN